MTLAGKAEAGFCQLQELGIQDKDSLGKVTGERGPLQKAPLISAE